MAHRIVDLPIKMEMFQFAMLNYQSVHWKKKWWILSEYNGDLVGFNDLMEFHCNPGFV